MLKIRANENTSMQNYCVCIFIGTFLDVKGTSYIQYATDMCYRKIPKHLRHPKKLAVITLKFKQCEIQT